MYINTFVQDWIAVSNAYDTAGYLKKWHKDAILNDPSVGKIFKGHTGIRTYFENYFIGYKTQSKLVTLNIIDAHTAHIELQFTGEFPEEKINGTFDLTFKDGKIIAAKADLI